MRRRIGIAGAGAWGSALGRVAERAGHVVAWWSRQDSDPSRISHCDLVILAVPAQACRDVLARIAPVIETGEPIVIAAKGIERQTGLFLHQVVAEIVPRARAYVLSGPSFAIDVSNSLPTAVTLAAPTLGEAGEWAGALGLPLFRIYGSDDVLGVAIGGALKNVLAIACGICDGRQHGDSARAALTTRGFAELMRFGIKLGARPETLTGLAGLGDLLLTCSSRQSRNYAFGFAIGTGRTPAEAHAAALGVVEGAHTARIAAELARKHGVDMPIIAAVNAIIDEGAKAEDEIARLLARPAQAEFRT